MKSALGTIGVANRGEIAVRVIRAAKELGLETVALFDELDKTALHTACADVAVPCDLLEKKQVLRGLVDSGVTSVHPGYGLWSEDPTFARQVEEAGLKFIGPSSETLSLFGNKIRARAFAATCGLPVLKGSENAFSTADEVEIFMRMGALDFPVMLKATDGGGGRGISRATSIEDVRAAFSQLNPPELFVEELLHPALHIEVQVVGDGVDAIHLFDRNCTIQSSKFQKVLEVAPALEVDPTVREKLLSCATELLKSARYCGVGTVEFLVNPVTNKYVFLEVNPRVQVEHTVTEEITGVDIVETQFRIASGEPLSRLFPPERLAQIQRTAASTVSVQARVCLTAPGVCTRLSEPAGKGVRVDSGVQVGTHANIKYDPLLLKIICSGSSFPIAIHRLSRSLRELYLQGIPTNQTYLAALSALMQERSSLQGVYTDFLQSAHAQLDERMRDLGPLLQEDLTSPLNTDSQDEHVPDAPPHAVKVLSPAPASVSKVLVKQGDYVHKDQAIAVLSSMKMDISVSAPDSGRVLALFVKRGGVLHKDSPMLYLDPTAKGSDGEGSTFLQNADDPYQQTLQASQEHANKISKLRSAALEMGGTDAVRRHHEKGRKTIRERILLLLDDGEPFKEVGRAAFGNFVLGTGSIQGRTVVVGGEDFTQSGGSPTVVGLRKSVYTETLALELRKPLVRLHEGGGGSVGGTKGKDAPNNKGPVGSPVFERPRFESVARVLQTVPVATAALGPVAGLPASRLVASHFSVMTDNAQVLVAGPAVVERALGYQTTKEQLGGHHVHLANGVVDNLASDEQDALRQIRTFLSFLPDSVDRTPPVLHYSDSDVDNLRGRSLDTLVSPTNRREVYAVREIVRNLFDEDSFFEMTKDYGPSLVTGLARLNGHPLGVIANDCAFFGGAMTADAARKVHRFLTFLEQFSLPVVYLVDEPGFFIGLQAEQQGTIRSGTETVLKAATFPLPSASVVLRKAYGVAAAAHFSPQGRQLLWPTSEMGALPVESGVAVAFKRMLDQIQDDQAREAARVELETKFAAQLDPFARAEAFSAHEIIMPRETRTFLLDWLHTTWHLVARHVATKQHCSNARL